MPTAAPRPCGHPGCGALVRDGSGRCAKHAKEAWVKPVTATKRRTGRWLQEQRADLFRREPLCAECNRQGRVSLAVIRDHIIPLGEQGEDSKDNEQGLCIACNDVKTKAESARGVKRHYAGR